MTRAANLSVIAAAACVGLAALVMAWANTTRSTGVVGQGVYRENLITGEDQFCGVNEHGAYCLIVTDPYRPERRPQG